MATMATTTTAPTQHHFDPYGDNGGTAIAIAGADFAIMASDTRQSNGYSINTRYAPKAFQLFASIFFSPCGFYADATAMTKALQQRLIRYEFKHEKEMSIVALAQMLSITLYHKRFFPYYVHSILAGVDNQGLGCIFSYDPVGSYERHLYQAAGSASHLVQPFLDNQIGYKNTPLQGKAPLPTLEQALRIAKDAFTSATERDIYTGDLLEIFIITKEGVTVQQYPLKKD